MKTSNSQALDVAGFVLESGPSDAIMKAAMNRYRPLNTSRGINDAGYILLFAHGTGFHKEIWEPTIEHLFAIDKPKRDCNEPSKILECWAIDCQNHGISASLNDDILVSRPGILDINFYADAFVRLYHSGLLGVRDRNAQKVVILGHSAGSVGTVFATALFGPPSCIPFDRMILIDPPIFASELKNKMTPMYRLVEKTTPSRRAIWNSKEKAHAFFKARPPWNTWDPRVLALYTEFGLRDLPNPYYPDKEGVALICSPADEVAAFRQSDTSLQALAHLNKICGAFPVHLIFGARNDMFSREVQDSIHDPVAGRTIASVTRVPEAGHLVVQEKPDSLAEAIHSVLHKQLAKL